MAAAPPTVTARVLAGLQAIESVADASPYQGAGSFIHNIDGTKDFAAGSGATQSADRIYTVDAPGTGAGPDDYDLSASLLGQFTGNPAFETFVRVKAVVVHNTHATLALTIGPAAAVGWLGVPTISPFALVTDTISCPPGGSIVLLHPTTGWLPTAATWDVLRVTRAAGTTYELGILGASA